MHRIPPDGGRDDAALGAKKPDTSISNWAVPAEPLQSRVDAGWVGSLTSKARFATVWPGLKFTLETP